jgi:type VI protein secretion system component Hcp
MEHARFYIAGKATGSAGSGDDNASGGYELLSYKFSTSREYDKKGQPATGLKALLVEVEIYAYAGGSVLIGMYIDMYQQVSGNIDFYRTDHTGGNAKYRTIKFENAYVVSYEEQFEYNVKLPMTIKLVISAGKLNEEGNNISHDWAK